MKTLKPVDSNEITKLISEGRAGEIVSRMKAYETQQAQIKEGILKTQRVCCKPNKNGNLYIQHGSIENNTKSMNFHTNLEPAVKALVTNDELLEMVRAYYREGSMVEEVRLTPRPL